MAERSVPAHLWTASEPIARHAADAERLLAEAHEQMRADLAAKMAEAGWPADADVEISLLMNQGGDLFDRNEVKVVAEATWRGGRRAHR